MIRRKDRTIKSSLKTNAYYGDLVRFLFFSFLITRKMTDNCDENELITEDNQKLGIHTLIYIINVTVSMIGYLLLNPSKTAERILMQFGTYIAYNVDQHMNDFYLGIYRDKKSPIKVTKLRDLQIRALRKILKNQKSNSLIGK